MKNQTKTKKCKSCQKEIDNKATKCPYCQTDQRNWFRRHPILTMLIAFFVLPILIGIFSPSPKKPEQINKVKRQEITEAKKKQSEEERQKNVSSLANKFCENRQGEYSYDIFFCSGCVDLWSIVEMLRDKGSVSSDINEPALLNTLIVNAKKPPTEKICKEVAELCLEIWGEKECQNMAEQKIWIGMDYHQLYITMGVPKDKNDTVGSWGVHSQWVYGDFGPYIYLEGRSKRDLLVTSWQD